MPFFSTSMNLCLYIPTQLNPRPCHKTKYISLNRAEANIEINPEDWPQEEAEGSGNSSSGNVNGGNSDHLWEESWDDDDTNEDFSKQLKYIYPPHPLSACQRAPMLTYIAFCSGRNSKRWKQGNNKRFSDKIKIKT